MPEINPIQREPARSKPWHDRADGGLPIERLEGILADVDQQPLWRDTADVCCDAYDGKQLTDAQRLAAEQAGLDPRISNLIKPVINSVLGQEAKSRRDPKLEPDSDDMADVADVLQVKLKEAQRETNSDMAISDSYAGEIKAGIGWTFVGRASDPLAYPYVVEDVPRNSIWWDWRCLKRDISLHAQWLVRREWKDLDDVAAAYPEHADILEMACNNFSTFPFDYAVDERIVEDACNRTDTFRRVRSEWMDSPRRRIRMYEVWYRVPAAVVVMQVRGRWVPWNKKNPVHVKAAAAGLVPLKRGNTQQVRQAIYAGPFRLSDEGTTKRRFPYIPFMGFRADSDNTPYGMVHSMLDPQRDYNDRYLRVQWALKAQQLLIDNDALDTEFNTIDDITATMMRPDMVAILNGNRKGKDGMVFRNDFTLQKEQFEAMQNAKLLIEQTAGVFQSQLGSAPAGVTSGLAINSLVEQGLVSMGEINDNYTFSRRLVYEALLDEIVQDHLERDLQVTIGSGDSKRVVVLNTIDPQTNAPMNVVKDAAVTVGLSEAPSSAAFQMQQSQQMADMIRALAGTPAVAVLIPTWIEQTTAFGPNRKQLAEDARRVLGLPSAGDRQGAQQWQQQQQQQAAVMAAMNEALAKAKLDSEQASAVLKSAQALLARANAMKAAAEAEAVAMQPSEDEVISKVLQEAAAA